MPEVAKRFCLMFGALAIVVVCGRPAAATNDYYWSRLWNLRTVGADKAWSAGTGKGTTIAVVDTGVDGGHEDLARNVVSGYDFVDKDTDPRDENGHGTHVSGIAAAIANNGLGVAGVAPDAKVMPVRVLGADGSGTADDVDAGIHFAVDHGADVVNLSLGDNVIVEDASGGTMTDAVNYAWSKGVICVVAAGNDNLFRTEIRRAKAIIVTATDRHDQQASYATGVGLAPWGIAAPGGDRGEADNAGAVLSSIWSRSGRRYGYAVGTSMAAPHVSGAAAVLRGLGLSAQQTVDRLLDTARDIGPSGNDLTYGHGLLNVDAAVAMFKRPSRTTAGGSNSGGSSRAPSTSGEPAAPNGPARHRGPTSPPREAERAAGTSPEASALFAEPKERSRRSSGFANVVIGSVVAAAALAAGAHWWWSSRA